MKTFRTIILIAGILVAGMAFKSVAQNNPQNNTKAEKEIYALTVDKHKDKHKTHMMKVNPKSKNKNKTQRQGLS
jgi:hypothetical protein